MDKIVKNILKSIESKGYEAYVVGGYVRDILLGKKTYDVDICTNALPKQIMSIFSLNQKPNGYGGFNFKIKQYNIDITTYRKELRYQGRNPVEIEYVNSLDEDIKRRDFTINSLCMDQNGHLIDILSAKDDLAKKLIRSLGNASQKFIEDPLRIIRAIRFACTLDFTIEDETYTAIVKHKDKVKTLSSDRIKEELTKILSSPNYQKGLDLLQETGLKDCLNLAYSEVKYTRDILGMWAQIDNTITFSKAEKDSIDKIKHLLKMPEINNFSLFNNGLYVCQVAGEIMGIDKKTLNNRYKHLPIKSMKDIQITGKEIIALLNIKPSKKVTEIINDLKKQILNGNLKNKKKDLIKYIMGSEHNG